MTITEALSRVANRYSSTGYAGLNAQGQQTALDAINAGMMDLFRLLPAYYREKSLQLAVDAPATVAIDTVNGSDQLGASAFTAEQVGRTVVAVGDEAQHRVAGAGALRDVWLGQSGTFSATVYHDYVYGGDYPFDRLLGVPALVAGGTEIPLVSVQPEEVDYAALRGVGRPRFYWLEHGGVSQGGDVVVAIRLLPLPDAAYRLRVRASYWPRRALYEDVANNVVLPIPDVVAEAFIQLAGVHTIGLVGWDRMAADKVLAQADVARSHAGMLPQSVGVSYRRVGTPRGW